ncbi:hypothetical protein D3C73_1406260 [compost metagenome]
MPFTWILWRASSTHIPRVSIFTAPFEAAYGVMVSRPSSLCMEQMLMTFPAWRSTMRRVTACDTRNTAVWFTAITSFQSCSGNSVNG